jgi:hypothetical protein
MVREKTEEDANFEKLLDRKDKVDPYTAAEEIINKLFNKK